MPTDTRTDRLLTVPEVARYLGVSNDSVYRLVATEGLPSYKVGGQRRFRRSAIDEWLEGQSSTREGES